MPLTVTASIGIAGGQRNSASELLRDADIALYRAKALGKNRSALFQPEMQTAVLDRIELDADLRIALAEEQFFLLYQPVFDLDHVSVSGVEALLRWRHPVRGVVPPDQFIPMLEDSGLIVEVGRWVLFEACRQAAQWHGRGYQLSMSVNVSMRQLEIHAFVDHIKEALARDRARPDVTGHRDHREHAHARRRRHGAAPARDQGPRRARAPSTTSAPATRRSPTSASSPSTR